MRSIDIRAELDRVERLFAGTGNYPCDIAEYHGRLDEAAMAQAYVILSHQCPTLSARMRHSEAYCEFDPISEDEDERVRFIDGGAVDLQRDIRELRLQDRDAARLVIARESRDRGLVALCVNHALFDFPSFGFLFNKLWSLYTRICNGSPLSSLDVIQYPLTLPASPERILVERWLDSAASLPASEHVTLQGKKTTPIIQTMVELSTVETNSLIQTSRDKSLTIHQVLCASILTALRNHDTHPAGEEPMVCRSAVNLRDRVEPKIGDTETTVLQGFHEAKLNVSLNADLCQVGSKIKTSFVSDMTKSKLKMAWERTSIQADSLLDKKLSQVTVTNWGVLPRLEQPSSLRVIDRMKCWLNGEEASWIGRNPIYILGTYENRLKIVGMYSSAKFASDEVADIMGRIMKPLRELIQ